jgi:two-component system, OmpR family, response regulator
MKILVVEDDAVLADGLFHTLAKVGFSVVNAMSGTYASQLLMAQDFDLCVLDLGLPDMDGLDLLREIRRQRLLMPVLILTARDAIDDRIRGINDGADDYMTKPFELKELEARINALIRRCYGGFQEEIVFGCLKMNVAEQQILADGEALVLPPREYDVLEILLLQAGKVVCKERLAQRLTSTSEAVSDNAIEIYIHRLRKRLDPLGMAIRTLRGLGYVLELAHGGQ